MYPLLHIGRVAVPTFALCIALGVNASCVVIACGADRSCRINELWQWMGFLLVFALGGRVGEEVLYNRGSIAWGISGGNSILGSIAFGILFIAVRVAAARCDWRSEADRYVLPLLALQFAGKIGCFLAGCCQGRACDLPWGVAVPTGSSAHQAAALLHPVQLYEGFLYAVLAAVIAVVGRRGGRGMQAGAYLVGYGAIRIGAELFRGDTVAWVPGITLGQAAAGVIVAVGGVVLAVSRGQRKILVDSMGQRRTLSTKSST